MIEKLEYCIERLGVVEFSKQTGFPERTVRHWRHDKRIPSYFACMKIKGLYKRLQSVKEVGDE